MTKPFGEGLRRSSRGPIPVPCAGDPDPIEIEGACPPPEAHVKRFMLKLGVRYRGTSSARTSSWRMPETALGWADRRRWSGSDGYFLGKRKGLAASTSANPSSFMVAGAGFEPATFGL